VARAAGEAGATSVATIAPPLGVPLGWDAADAEAAGWDEKRAGDLVASAAPANGESGPRPRRKRQRDYVIGAVIDTQGVELWRDPGGATYATVPVNGHAENWSLRSHGLERWLSGLYYRKTGVALSGQALEDIRRTLDIKAYEDGAQYEPFVRVGGYNGRIYLDLCNDTWRAVEITARGWHIVDRPAVKFLRSVSARPLPEPEAGDVIERLRGFINVANEDDFKLIVSWLVSALRPGSPFPILIVNGVQGTGKSVLCRLLRSLIDPDLAMICAAPKDERDLVLAASNTWVQALDNLSDVNGFLPDALCRLASGAGFRTRSLHTNRDETVFSVQRPILLNGIPTLTEQADVGRRSVVINLVGIPPERRQAEGDFSMEFESVRGRILGALLEGVSRALSAIDSIKVERPGSMADFEKWSMAAAPAFGWQAGEFQTAYRKNQAVVVTDTFEADAVAVAIKDFIMKNHAEDGWEGTPTALQFELNKATPERIRNSRSWPKTPAQLGNRIKRAQPLLEHKGFTIDRRHSGTRTITITPPRQPLL
jgi:putative DNA primase/helicase